MGLTFYKPLRIVEVDLPDTNISMQNLINDIRDWEDDLENLGVFEVIAGAGKEELGDGVSVGITLTLKGWRLKFADRPGPDWVLCNVGGGNLTCVTGTNEEIRLMSGITYINPIAPAAYVTVTKTSSSSATLQDQTSLQTSIYGGIIYVDSVSGSSGTIFPKGTLEFPINNWPEAIEVANTYSIPKITFKQDYIFGATDNLNNWNLFGVNDHIDLTMTSGVTTDKTIFDTATLHGTFNGTDIGIYNCRLNGVSGLDANVYNSMLMSDIKLAGTGTVNFLNCHSGVPGSGTPTIDMNESGVSLAVRKYAGGIRLINKSGPEAVSLDYTAGQLRIESTVTSGDIIVRGVGKLAYNSGNANLDTDGLVGIKIIEESLTIGNRSVSFIMATGDIPSRNVASGMIDYMTVKYKYDIDPDWSSPRREQSLYYWYENLGDGEPIKVKENG